MESILFLNLEPNEVDPLYLSVSYGYKVRGTVVTGDGMMKQNEGRLKDQNGYQLMERTEMDNKF
jgi:hypothetical protein